MRTNSSINFEYPITGRAINAGSEDSHEGAGYDPSEPLLPVASANELLSNELAQVADSRSIGDAGAGRGTSLSRALRFR